MYAGLEYNSKPFIGNLLIISLRQLQTGSLKNSVWGKCKLSACGLSLAAVRETASITVSWARWSR